MLDEPSMGLAPILVEQIFDITSPQQKGGHHLLVEERMRRWPFHRRQAVCTGNRAHCDLGPGLRAAGRLNGEEGLPGRITGHKALPGGRGRRVSALCPILPELGHGAQ
jgi:hypothetical protein